MAYFVSILFANVWVGMAAQWHVRHGLARVPRQSGGGKLGVGGVGGAMRWDKS